MSNNEFLSRRGTMALMASGLWLLLCLYAVPAFWDHLATLETSYPIATRAGACVSGFGLLCMLLLHCFDKHLAVRKWALVFSVILAGAELIHAGALRGLQEATQGQRDTESRMAETLTKMSTDQARAIQVDQSGTQRERLAKSRAALAAQGDVAKAAQKEVAATIGRSADVIKDNSILPKWYLDGWMYSALFLLTLVQMSVLFALMMRGSDIDADYNGIPDAQERRIQAGFASSVAAHRDYYPKDQARR